MSQKIIDANMLLRLILRDDPKMADTVVKIIDSSVVILLNEIAAEVVYVLSKFYKIDRKSVAAAFLSILEIDTIKPSEPAVLKTALKIFAERSLDFADCLLAAYHSVYGYEICTFDEKLNKALRQTDNA